MECVFLGKPIVVFGSHEFSRLPGVYQYKKDQSLQDLREYILNRNYYSAKHSEKLNILSHVYNNSHDAILWDPVNQPEHNSNKNYKRLSNAIEETINKL